MAAKLTLNCWILGLNNADAFSVDILRSRTVSHLKKEIKEAMAPDLNHISAPSLGIWKVNSPAQRTRHY